MPPRPGSSLPRAVARPMSRKDRWCRGISASAFRLPPATPAPARGLPSPPVGAKSSPAPRLPACSGLGGWRSSVPRRCRRSASRAPRRAAIRGVKRCLLGVKRCLLGVKRCLLGLWNIKKSTRTSPLRGHGGTPLLGRAPRAAAAQASGHVQLRRAGKAGRRRKNQFLFVCSESRRAGGSTPFPRGPGTPRPPRRTNRGSPAFLGAARGRGCLTPSLLRHRKERCRPAALAGRILGGGIRGGFTVGAPRAGLNQADPIRKGSGVERPSPRGAGWRHARRPRPAEGNDAETHGDKARTPRRARGGPVLPPVAAFGRWWRPSPSIPLPERLPTGCPAPNPAQTPSPRGKSRRSGIPPRPGRPPRRSLLSSLPSLQHSRSKSRLERGGSPPPPSRSQSGGEPRTCAIPVLRSRFAAQPGAGSNPARHRERRREHAAGRFRGCPVLGRNGPFAPAR